MPFANPGRIEVIADLPADQHDLVMGEIERQRGRDRLAHRDHTLGAAHLRNAQLPALERQAEHGLRTFPSEPFHSEFSWVGLSDCRACAPSAQP